MSKKIFYVLLLAISYIGVGVVSYHWAAAECAMYHLGASAPPEVSLIYGIPFVVCIMLVLVVYWAGNSRVKGKRQGKSKTYDESNGRGQKEGK